MEVLQIRRAFWWHSACPQPHGTRPIVAHDFIFMQENYEWKESAPLNEGRFKFHMVVAGSKIYAVGGEGAFSAHDNIEVIVGHYKHRS